MDKCIVWRKVEILLASEALHTIECLRVTGIVFLPVNAVGDIIQVPAR